MLERLKVSRLWGYGVRVEGLRSTFDIRFTEK